jgi:hypothetical protein
MTYAAKLCELVALDIALKLEALYLALTATF